MKPTRPAVWCARSSLQSASDSSTRQLMGCFSFCGEVMTNSVRCVRREDGCEMAGSTALAVQACAPPVPYEESKVLQSPESFLRPSTRSALGSFRSTPDSEDDV